jgi:hypothetical protein
MKRAAGVDPAARSFRNCKNSSIFGDSHFSRRRKYLKNGGLPPN